MISPKTKKTTKAEGKKRVDDWLRVTYIHLKSEPLIALQTGDRQVKEHLKLHLSRIDHVAIRSELRYLIGVKDVDFQGWVFCEETGPIATVRVFDAVRFRFQPEPEQ